jgi:hypothetical protein
VQEATGCWAASDVRLGRRRSGNGAPWMSPCTKATGCWAASDGAAWVSPCSEAMGCWAASEVRRKAGRRLGEEGIPLTKVSYFALISCVIVGT